jgi:hypothetical protein
MGEMITKNKIFDRKIVIRLKDRLCETPEELVDSELFERVLKVMLTDLKKRQSRLLDIFNDKNQISDDDVSILLQTIHALINLPLEQVPNIVPASKPFTRDPHLLEEFLRYFYNYWRSFDRFLICHSADDHLDKRPYRTFHSSAEQLMHLVRSVWRSVYEHVNGAHPNIFRQVSSGAGVAAITTIKTLPLPAGYEALHSIPLIRDIMLFPPLVIDPPMNKRKGQFEEVAVNPLSRVSLAPDEWLCYPALVGKLLINIYFHESFYDLGFALTNLFELADDQALEARKPDAVCLFGVQGTALDDYGVFPTIFYDDSANQLLVGAVPGRPEFGYFGYLKKMALTLHNICIMKSQRLPYHGALFHIILKSGKQATVLVMGDSGTGKSETLEALRILGDDIQDIIIVADDMGSLDIDAKGRVIGYGTEVGAFIRLDDLQPGYAFGQIDRTIIMNAGQTNARVVLPVTSHKYVTQGFPVDIVLYANNYEQVDAGHPVIEAFATAQHALEVFRTGHAMSKGTTSASGMVHSYFANVFGPAQYPQLHDEIAGRYFRTFSEAGLFVGQMRTRLSIPSWEQRGPEAAARALLDIIRSR